jgi:hypothetical protein
MPIVVRCQDLVGLRCPRSFWWSYSTSLQLRFPPKPILERVPRPICQKCAHPRSSEPRCGLCGVETILICWIAVYTLSLRLAPTDAPCRVPCGCGQRDDMFYIARRCAKWPFKNGHATHRATDNHTNGLYAEVVENEFVEAEKVEIMTLVLPKQS